MLLKSLITGDIHSRFGGRAVFKGGGGGGTTTTSGIDAEFKPDLKKGLGIATDLLEQQQSDPSSIVAGLTPEQQEALNRQTGFARDKMDGTGIYDMAAAEKASLQGLAGENLAAAQAGGFLGSARANAATQAALAGRAGEYQKMRQGFADQGVTQLGEAGTTQQQQTQRELEARDQSLDRYFNRLTGVAPKTTTQSGGGGK